MFKLLFTFGADRVCFKGNHALALAHHGKELGIPVTCVMPYVAPLTKITSCQNLGANVVLHGAHILEARVKADEIAKDEVRNQLPFLEKR